MGCTIPILSSCVDCTGGRDVPIIAPLKADMFNTTCAVHVVACWKSAECWHFLPVLMGQVFVTHWLNGLVVCSPGLQDNPGTHHALVSRPPHHVTCDLDQKR
jgi:hypothetical protein